jgi:aminoglycoside/choline kinase family phosphotransferase
MAEMSETQASAALPVEVEDLTPAWLSSVLGHEVREATVLDRSTGTTGRARLALHGDPALPTSVFVKLPPFDEQQRAFVDATRMGVTEARFYRDLASESPVRVPQVWYAALDGPGYVMVLEDLVASGCTFPSPDDGDIAARAGDVVENLAALHARYWESDRFGAGRDLEWLAKRGMGGGDGGRQFIRRAVDVLGGRLGDDLDDPFHRIAELYLGRTGDIVQLWHDGPGTVIHGDPHVGNLFVDADGRTGFLDWAVICRAPGLRDVAYTMCSSVPSDVREAIEREVVERYCDRLEAAGVSLDVADAWDQYRLHAMYAWVAAASTAAMGSKWQPIEIGMAGTRRATAACAHLDGVGLLASRLD